MVDSASIHANFSGNITLGDRGDAVAIKVTMYIIMFMLIHMGVYFSHI